MINGYARLDGPGRALMPKLSAAKAKKGFPSKPRTTRITPHPTPDNAEKSPKANLRSLER